MNRHKQRADTYLNEGPLPEERRPGGVVPAGDADLSTSTKGRSQRNGDVRVVLGQRAGHVTSTKGRSQRNGDADRHVRDRVQRDRTSTKGRSQRNGDTVIRPNLVPVSIHLNEGPLPEERRHVTPASPSKKPGLNLNEGPLPEERRPRSPATQPPGANLNEGPLPEERRRRARPTSRGPRSSNLNEGPLPEERRQADSERQDSVADLTSTKGRSQRNGDRDQHVSVLRRPIDLNEGPLPEERRPVDEPCALTVDESPQRRAAPRGTATPSGFHRYEGRFTTSTKGRSQRNGDLAGVGRG